MKKYLYNWLLQGSSNEVGNIFNESSFASTSDFPITGATITRGSGKLDMAGSPTLFASYCKFDASSSAHRYTGLEHWKQRLRVKTPSSITSSSYGIGIGIQSANTYDPYTMTLRWSWDTGGPGALGSLYLYNKATVAGQIQSSGAYTPVAATYYWIEIERIKNSVLFTLFSDAGTQLFTETLSFTLSSGYVQAPNVGQFVVHHFGGSGIEVTDWVTSSMVERGNNYCVIGDSNTYGLFATANNLRWAELAMDAAGLTYSVNAGIADRTEDVILKLPEIIALRPQKVLLSVGRNDVANSIAIGTIQTNVNTIISTLEAANITVQLCGVIASNVDVSAVQTHYSGKSNAQVNFYTATKSATTTLNATYNSGDAIHINTVGHEVLADLVAPLLTGSDSGYGTGYEISIATDLYEDRVNVIHDGETKAFTITTPENWFASWEIRESWTDIAVASGSGVSASFTGDFNKEIVSGFETLQQGVKFYDINVVVTKNGNSYSRRFRRALAVYPALFTEGTADVVWDLSTTGLTKDGSLTNRPGYKIFVKGAYSGAGYMNMYNWVSNSADNPIHLLFDPASVVTMTTSNAYVWRVNESCKNIIIDGSGNFDVRHGFVGTQSGGTFAQSMIIEPIGSTTTAGNEGQNVTVSGLRYVGNNTTGAGINVNFTHAARAEFNYDNYTYNNLHIFNTEVEDVNDEAYYLGYFNDSESGGYAHPKTVNSVFAFNRAINPGADAFQIGSWTNSEIHNNYCEDAGNNNNSSHRNMLQLIAPQNTYVYRNYLNNIANNTSNSLNLATGRGGGNVYLWSNVFDNRNTSAHNNVFINIQENEYDDVIESFIYNNTFISDFENPIEIWNATASPVVNTYFNPLYLVDNIILSINDASQVEYFNSPTTTYYTVDNMFSQSSTAFGFNNYATGDLSPASIDAAMYQAQNNFTKTHVCAEQDYLGYGFAQDVQGAYSGVPLLIEGGRPDTTPPNLVSATIEDGAATSLVMVFDEVVTATNLGFTIAGTTSTTFSSISGSGTNTITGTLGVAATNGQTITLSYSSSTGDLVDAGNNELVTFSGTAVTNNVGAAGSVDLKINILTGSASGWVATGATTPSQTATTDYGQMGSSGIGLRSTSDAFGTYEWNSTGTGGPTTGANTGVFPDNVMLSYWYCSGTDIGRLELYNHTGTPLNAGTFEIKIHSGRGVAGTRTTRFRVNGGAWQSLNSCNNTANVVTFTGVSDVSGVITIECQSTTPTDSAFGYFNGFTIISE